MSAVRHIAGRVAIVTGGASGLGRGTAERLVKNGAKVVLADLPSSAGAEVAARLGATNALFVPTDVTSEGDVKSLMDESKKAFGKCDVAVNAAGILAGALTFSAKKPDPEARLHCLDIFQVSWSQEIMMIRLWSWLVVIWQLM